MLLLTFAQLVLIGFISLMSHYGLIQLKASLIDTHTLRLSRTDTQTHTHMHTPTNSASLVACVATHTLTLFCVLLFSCRFAFLRTISLELQLKLIFIELLCFLVYSFSSLRCCCCCWRRNHRCISVFTWHREFTAPLGYRTVRSVVKIVHCTNHCGGHGHSLHRNARESH